MLVWVLADLFRSALGGGRGLFSFSALGLRRSYAVCCLGSGHCASGVYPVAWRPARWARPGGGSSAVCLLAAWGFGPFFTASLTKSGAVQSGQHRFLLDQSVIKLERPMQ
ncbi:hypothetical protein N836_34595 [Leptolyngbya sp. Heron Island J]|nr:hypothetical protein N836_34595 [Leptolyngbya sp. Heron Island J]